MNKKRNSLRIMFDILDTINKKKAANPTHILYKSNLSYKMLKGYLEGLLGKNFIKEEVVKKKRIYIITKKGREFLSEYSVMTNFLDRFGL